MGIGLVDNFTLSAKKTLDTREMWDSLSSLKANTTIIMPKGFMVYCKAENKRYTMDCTDESDPGTYVWSELATGTSEGGDGSTESATAIVESYVVGSGMGKDWLGAKIDTISGKIVTTEVATSETAVQSKSNFVYRNNNTITQVVTLFVSTSIGSGKTNYASALYMKAGNTVIVGDLTQYGSQHHWYKATQYLIQGVTLEPNDAIYISVKGEKVPADTYAYSIDLIGVTEAYAKTGVLYYILTSGDVYQTTWFWDGAQYTKLNRDVDLSEYAKLTDIPTIPDLSIYATKTELDGKEDTLPFKFGVTEDGSYGYIKEGETTITPWIGSSGLIDSISVNGTKIEPDETNNVNITVPDEPDLSPFITLDDLNKKQNELTTTQMLAVNSGIKDTDLARITALEKKVSDMSTDIYDYWTVSDDGVLQITSSSSNMQLNGDILTIF